MTTWQLRTEPRTTAGDQAAVPLVRRSMKLQLGRLLRVGSVGEWARVRVRRRARRVRGGVLLASTSRAVTLAEPESARA
jgi:hypothetical protein